MGGCLVFLWAELCICNKVTGKLRISCPQTSHFLLPLMLNHFTAHSSCMRLRAPLQLHSSLREFPCSQSPSRQTLQTASPSGISSSPSSKWEGLIWSVLPYYQIYHRKLKYRKEKQLTKSRVIVSDWKHPETNTLEEWMVVYDCPELENCIWWNTVCMICNVRSMLAIDKEVKGEGL